MLLLLFTGYLPPTDEVQTLGVEEAGESQRLTWKELTEVSLRFGSDAGQRRKGLALI